MASLIDAGKAFPRQKFKVPPNLARQDRVIGDWFDHGNIRLTLAGIIAKSSNIGTVLAADAFSPPQLVDYLQRFGLGQKTNVGVSGETPGILTPGDAMTSQTKDRVAFGQSLSVNVLQMAAAVNTIANEGVRVSPSLISGTRRHRRRRHRRHRHRHPHPRRQQGGRARHREDDGEGRRPRGRRRAARRGPGLPRRRQDRHRAARRRRSAAATTAARRSPSAASRRPTTPGSPSTSSSTPPRSTAAAARSPARSSPGSWATCSAATASSRPTASRRVCPSSGESIRSVGGSARGVVRAGPGRDPAATTPATPARATRRLAAPAGRRRASTATSTWPSRASR